jgi:hypothetical protein
MGSQRISRLTIRRTSIARTMNDEQVAHQGGEGGPHDAVDGDEPEVEAI